MDNRRPTIAYSAAKKKYRLNDRDLAELEGEEVRIMLPHVNKRVIAFYLDEEEVIAICCAKYGSVEQMEEKRSAQTEKRAKTQRENERLAQVSEAERKQKEARREAERKETARGRPLRLSIELEQLGITDFPRFLKRLNSCPVYDLVETVENYLQGYDLDLNLVLRACICLNDRFTIVQNRRIEIESWADQHCVRFLESRDVMKYIFYGIGSPEQLIEQMIETVFFRKYLQCPRRTSDADRRALFDRMVAIRRRLPIPASLVSSEIARRRLLIDDQHRMINQPPISEQMYIDQRVEKELLQLNGFGGRKKNRKKRHRQRLKRLYHRQIKSDPNFLQRHEKARQAELFDRIAELEDEIAFLREQQAPPYADLWR